MTATFLVIWLAILAFGWVTTLVEFRLSGDFKQMLMSEHSPYATILRAKSGIPAVVLGLIYCFGKASGSEELLFRGLIAKRFYHFLGFPIGNVIQALIF